MITVEVSQFDWVRGREAIDTLNRLTELHHEWTSRLLRGAIGCERDEAVALLWLLYHYEVAKPFLVAFHKHYDDEIPLPIIHRDFFDGPVTFPFNCPECENEINSAKELDYELRFEIIEKIRFA